MIARTVAAMCFLVEGNLAMPKLAIYIRKADMREIDRWRSKINFSKVFIDAVQREIRELSRRVEASDDELAEAAEHYRQAMADDDGGLVELGYRLGTRHVVQCQLPPEQIRDLLVADEDDTASAVDNVAAAMSVTGVGLEEYGRQHGFLELTHPVWADAFARGYTQGVADAWRKVCERMRTNAHG